MAREAAAQRKSDAGPLDRRFVRNARRNWNRFAMADSTGRELTYGRAAHGEPAVRMGARSRRQDEMIGVLLPPSVGGALANVGVTLAGRVPVNLNFTAGREAMAAAIAQCGIRTVITLEGVPGARPKLETLDGMVFVEDILGARPGKLGAGCARCWPRGWRRRRAAAAAHARFARHGDLLERQHGRSQGRDALALQRALQHRSDRAGVLDRRRATASWACCRSSIPSASR